MQKVWLACVGVALAASVSAQTNVTPPTTNYALTWDASVVDATHGAPDRYEWQIQPGATWASVGLKLSAPLPALPNGSYSGQTRGCNTGGCSPATSLAFTVGATVQAVPGSPSNLNLVPIQPTGNVASYRSYAMAPYASRTGSTLVPKPTGTLAGDTLLLVFTDEHNPAPTTTVTPPSGFSPLAGFPSGIAFGGSQVDLRAYYKIAGGSEPASYTVTHTGSALSTQAMLVAVSGGAGVPAVTVRKGTGVTSTATGMTTTVANTLLLFVDQTWDAFGNATPPAGTTPTWTERSDVAGFGLYLASGVMATPGATGNPAQGNQNTDAALPWQALLIAVAP